MKQSEIEKKKLIELCEIFNNSSKKIKFYNKSIDSFKNSEDKNIQKMMSEIKKRKPSIQQIMFSTDETNTEYQNYWKRLEIHKKLSSNEVNFLESIFSILEETIYFAETNILTKDSEISIGEMSKYSKDYFKKIKRYNNINIGGTEVSKKIENDLGEFIEELKVFEEAFKIFDMEKKSRKNKDISKVYLEFYKHLYEYLYQINLHSIKNLSSVFEIFFSTKDEKTHRNYYNLCVGTYKKN